MKSEKRLIDANRLIQDINADPYRTESEKSYVRCLVSRQPTVDAVEVVRCKDCKHYKPQNMGAHIKNVTPYCMRVVAIKVSPDDFCSYGERKAHV